MNDYLSKLNSDQLLAVNMIDGPVMIFAGAGTGKTRVITTRIVHILHKRLAKPNEILAVTFTNKAANEMKSRVKELANTELPFLRTFHSIAARILRDHAESVGLISDFIIIDVDDQLKLIKDIMKDLEESKDITEDLEESNNFKPKDVMNAIQRWKDKCLEPSEVVPENNSQANMESFAKEVYVQYQQQLMDHKFCDFGDLLLNNVKLFQNYPRILFQYQKQFKYIMVDEYQDTNFIQYQWLQYLSDVHSNICCVGDDDQSIYSWRGAEIENIAKFSDYFSAQTVKLERHYRSTSHILLAAYHIIKMNKERVEKKMWTENGEGEKVNLKQLSNEVDEANFLSNQICKLNKKKYKFSDIAILVRAYFQMRAIEESFMRNRIPHKILGRQKFYLRKEIKDVISYLRLVVNNNDNMAFERIVNQPKRSIGDASLKKIQKYASESKMSYFDAAIAMIEENKIAGKTKASLKEFLNKIKTWKELLEKKTLSEVVETIVRESGYRGMLDKEPDTGPVRIENVRELISSLKEYDDVALFLEDVSLMTDIDNMKSGDVVYVMTLHAAKGLEFPCVFLPGWEEGLMPNEKCITENGDKGLEEERRLAYVGMTRAKKKLTISYAQYRRGVGNFDYERKASRFVQELSLCKEHVQMIK